MNSTAVQFALSFHFLLIKLNPIMTHALALWICINLLTNITAFFSSFLAALCDICMPRMPKNIGIICRALQFDGCYPNAELGNNQG